MMDKDAIEHIQQSANIPALQADINDDTTKPVALVPDGWKLCDLEQFNDQASHFKALFKTHLPAEFTDYVNDNTSDNAKCFIDSDAMSAKAIFDLGTPEAPGHSHHAAMLTMQKTAAYKALLQITGTSLTQRQIAEFIQDWEDKIIVIDSAGEDMAPLMAADRLSDLRINMESSIATQVGDMSESRSAMEQIEAANVESIPAIIRFACCPYHGLPERTFVLRVSIMFDKRPKEDIAVKLRMIGAETAEEEMAQEVSDLLTSRLDADDIKMYVGSI